MTVNIYANCTYASTVLTTDLPALSNSFTPDGFFSVNVLIYTILSIVLIVVGLVLYYLDLCDRIVPLQEPKEVRFGYAALSIAIYIVGLTLVNPLIQVIVYAIFYSLWQSDLNNYAYSEVACISRIKGFPTSVILAPYFLLLIAYILYKKNNSKVFIEKRERMEKLSPYMKPVDSIEAGKTQTRARLLHFHAGRGKYLDIIADIFSRNCINTKTGYEIIALEAFQTKHFKETDYWLKQNARIMGLADCVTPVFCDFKTLNVTPSSIDAVLCGFDNNGSRMFMMGLKEDWKAIYKTLKPGGTVCFFAQVDANHKLLCEEAGFIDYQIVETTRFFVFTLTVVAMKKPGNVSDMHASIEEVVDTYKTSLTNMRDTVSRPSNINQVVSTDFIFPPGKAHRCIEALVLLTIVFFILYTVFCVGSYKALSVPTTVPYNYYISTNFVSNLTVIPYGFVFLYPQLREAADESSDDQSAVYRVLVRYRLFMVGLIVTLFVYNLFFYAIGLVIYLIVVNGSGKSPQTANTVTAIVITVIVILMVKNQTRIMAVVNHINNYFKKAEDNAGSSSSLNNNEVELRSTASINDNDIKTPVLNPIVSRID